MGFNSEIISRRQFFSHPHSEGGSGLRPQSAVSGADIPVPKDTVVFAVTKVDSFIRGLVDELSAESLPPASVFYDEASGDQQEPLPSLTGLYFKDVALSHSPSSPEKDFACGDRVQAKLRSEAELLSGPVLESRRVELQKIVADGLRAQEELIHSYLPFAAVFAKKQRERGVVYEDLIQEANLGLMRAAQDYNPDHVPQNGRQTLAGRMRFGTYAGWWIRSFVSRAVENQGRSLRLSNNMEQAMSKLSRMRSEHIAKYGVEPGLDELRAAYEAAPVSSISFDGVNTAFSSNAAQKFYSLERDATGEDNTLTLKDVIPDTNENVERDVVDRDPRSVLFELLPTIINNERQLHILVARFGLDGQEPRTLDAIGKEQGVTREAVRQQEAKALKKLRERLPSGYREDLEYFSRNH